MPCAPFWRALTYWPSSVSVRATFSAAGSLTSTSVRMVWPEAGASARRGAPPATGSTEMGRLALWITSRREPWSSRSPPARPSFSAPVIRGTPGPVAATAYKVSPATVKIVVPSVLTTSGSSTPSSWTFVVE